MQSKIIIGLTGEMGSGKDTFCEYVKSHYQNVYFFRFSDALTEILKLFFDDIKREDQQWLGETLRNKFGKDVLLKAVLRKANNIQEGIIILNGVRKPGEANSIKESGGKIFYITANQKLRWERVILRKEKADDNVPWEKFVEMGKAEAELNIGEVGKISDVRLENNGTKEDFYKEVKKIIESI